MRKTLFAGLTVLEDDESLLEDNAAFIGRDRDTIDHFLQVGALTHRHNGLPGLTNPTDGLASAWIVGSGGQIGAGLEFALGFTLTDASNGETLLGDTTVVSTPNPLDPPGQQLIGSAIYDAGGDLLVDTYYYATSWVDETGGETPVGAPIMVEREPGYTSAKIALGGLGSGMLGVGASGWRLYRATGGGAYNYLASGITDFYEDDGSDVLNCDIEPMLDDENTTSGDASLVIQLPGSGSIDSDASLINVYLSEDGTFVGDILLESFPVGSAGQHRVYRSIATDTGQPPDVNTSVGGASLIDPDTELLDWHWKRPVASAAALPSGARGDVRMALDTAHFWGMLRSPSGAPNQWTRVASAYTMIDIAASAVGGTVISDLDKIVFEGSGGTGVALQDLGGGSARVLIGGGGGGGAGSLRGITDADGPNISGAEVLEFYGSGNAIVGAVDMGGGSARVTIYASGVPGPQGIQGPPGVGGGGGGGAPLQEFPDPTQIGQGSAVTFRASGALGVAVDDLGGSAQVLYAPRGRIWASADAGVLGSGASAAVSLGLGAGYRLLEVRTNRKARVRAYSTPGDRSADLARVVGVDPTGDHGVMLDFLTTTDLSWRLSPMVDGHNMEEPPTNSVPLAITNHDPTGSTIVAFLYIPTEVV